MSYFNDPKYDVEVLKWYILNNENMSPTRYVQDLFVMDYTAANKKLNNGNYDRIELVELGNNLGMNKGQFMGVFFPEINEGETQELAYAPYDTEILKWYIINSGNGSPTRFVQHLYDMDYYGANKKLNRGNYRRNELAKMGVALKMTKGEFMAVFFPDMTGIPEE